MFKKAFLSDASNFITTCVEPCTVVAFLKILRIFSIQSYEVMHFYSTLKFICLIYNVIAKS
jgi:hypothetical protein